MRDQRDQRDQKDQRDERSEGSEREMCRFFCCKNGLNSIEFNSLRRVRHYSKIDIWQKKNYLDQYLIFLAISVVSAAISPVKNGVNSPKQDRPGLVVEADNDTCLGQHWQVSLSCFTVLISQVRQAPTAVKLNYFLVPNTFIVSNPVSCFLLWLNWFVQIDFRI